MFFCPTYRTNPATGEDEPYYRIKESYRDRLGQVHSVVLLSPGFIKGYSGRELNLTSKALNTLMEHKGEDNTLFGDILSDYPERVAALAREYWSLMEAKGAVDTFQEKKRRDETSTKGRLLLKGETLEHKEGRDLGAEWLCLQAVKQLGLDTFLLAQGWSEERVRFALAHLITRTVYAPSEWRSIRIIQENSAVADILGIDRDSVKKHDVYAVAPAFYQLKDKLDSYLTDKTDSLFGLTNRQLKTDLNLRPIYHQKDETSDAHLYMGLLSYWIVNTIRYQLKEKGEKSYWTEIVRIMSAQKLVRSKAANALGEIVEMEICTQPTQAAAAIYDKLGFRHYPFRKMKICSAQT